MEVAPQIVLDANILMAAILGVGARRIIDKWAGTAWLYAPDVCFEDVRRHLPLIAEKRGWGIDGLSAALTELDSLSGLVYQVEVETYLFWKQEAQARLVRSDVDDWPILATALAMNCPIWTEDRDFFGTGVATWITGLVEMFFTEVRPWVSNL